MNIITCPYCKKEFMKGNRSPSMNNYIHAIFNTIKKETGQSASIEQIKEDVMIAMGYTEERVNVVTGEEKTYRISTKDMDDKQCSDFSDELRKFAMEFFNLCIPDANEYKQGLRAYKV